MRLLVCTLLALLIFSAPASAGPLGGLAAVGAAFKAALTAKAVLGAILRAVIAAGVSLLAKRRAQKKQRPAGLQTTFTTKGGTDPQGTVIGYYATAGHVIYRNSHDKNHANLKEVIELGDMPGVTLRRVIIDGVVSELSLDQITGHQIIVVKSHNGNHHSVLKFYDGTQTAADPSMVGAFGGDPVRPWTPNHILTGIPYVVVHHYFASERYPNGKPDMRFELDGIPFYDPRKDSSVGGSGPQRWNNKATWAQTANNAVMIYNILRGIKTPTGEIWGGDAEAEDLPLSNWIAAMNVCSLGVGGNNRPQFRAGFEIRFQDEPAEVIEELLTGCNGQICEIGGVWTIQVGAPAASVVHITDDDILVSEPSEFDPFPGLEATHNAITVSHPSPAGLWNPSAPETILNTEWEVADGGQRLFELRLPTTPWAEQARQVAQNMIRDERRFRAHQHSLPPEYFWLQRLMTITWTSQWNSYSAKLFEITEVAYDLRTMNIAIGLRERDPNDFTFEPTLDLPGPVQTTTPIVVIDAGVPGFGAAPYTGLDNHGNPRRPGIRCVWDRSIANTTRGLSFQFRVMGHSDLAWSGILRDISDGSFALLGLLRDTPYQVRAKAMSRTRDTLWTGWLDVTTPDVGINVADMSDATWNAIHKDAIEIASAVKHVSGLRELESLIEAHQDRAQTSQEVALATEDLRKLVDEAKKAIVTSRQELTAQFNQNVASIVSVNKARADENGALAQTITALSTTVGDQSATLSEHATSLDGVYLEKTIRLDNNGHVSGLVLRSELDKEDAVVSKAAFVSDKFAIVGPDDAPTSPFVVYTTPQVIGGVTVEPGVYMRKAFIRNGVIGRAEVADTIQSDNYAENNKGVPTAGMKLNFKTGKIKAYGTVISRPMVLARGSFSISGQIGSGTWRFINTGIRVGKNDVWQASKQALIAAAAVTSGASSYPNHSGFEQFWGCTAEVVPGARWHGWVGGNPQPSVSYRRDPANLVTPDWASGTDQRVFIDVTLRTEEYVFFNNPVFQWVVFEVT